ncbi:MAG: hypothetical protein QX195_00625 [Methylococcaceae bacterium]|jgi:CMP-N-acetylneuraminic acid synthetase
MTTSKVTAVIPCRKGSQRVINKNTRPFGGLTYGLLELKLRQLDRVEAVDEIWVSTNDPVVMTAVDAIRVALTKPVILDIRPDEYAADDSLQALIAYLSRTIDSDVIAWTHVTSPFFLPSLYQAALTAYSEAVQKQTADSLMSVDVAQTFAMRLGQWISHDATGKKWPRTQDLDKIFLVNSALFVISQKLMVKLQDRVGQHALLFETPFLHGFDIDWEEEFLLGESLYHTLFKHHADNATEYGAKICYGHA